MQGREQGPDESRRSDGGQSGTIMFLAVTHQGKNRIRKRGRQCYCPALFRCIFGSLPDAASFKTIQVVGWVWSIDTLTVSKRKRERGREEREKGGRKGR